MVIKGRPFCFQHLQVGSFWSVLDKICNVHLCNEVHFQLLSPSFINIWHIGEHDTAASPELAVI